MSDISLQLQIHSLTFSYTIPFQNDLFMSDAFVSFKFFAAVIIIY